jgi:hypothetical protein
MIWSSISIGMMYGGVQLALRCRQHGSLVLTAEMHGGRLWYTGFVVMKWSGWNECAGAGAIDFLSLHLV